MSSLFSKALVYLGLVDEEQAQLADEDPGSQEEMVVRPVEAPTGPRRVEALTRIEGRRVEPPNHPTTRNSPARHDPGYGDRQVRAVRPVEVQSDILLIEEFGDAKILADRVRDRVPVVLDLRQTDPDLVRRVIDFASGLIYALDGTMTKVGEGVVLVLPPRVTLSRDEKRRLSRLGVYQLPGED